MKRSIAKPPAAFVAGGFYVAATEKAHLESSSFLYLPLQDPAQQTGNTLSPARASRLCFKPCGREQATTNHHSITQLGNQAMILKGKKGVVFGALDNQSIAWKVAERCVEEGAEIVLTNAPVAMRMGEINKLAEACKAPVIAADATSTEDLEELFKKSMEHFGGKVDFVLHSIGMSVNVRKGKSYTDLKYDWMQKTFDVSAISFP